MPILWMIMINKEQINDSEYVEVIKNLISKKNIAIGFVIYRPNEEQYNRIKSVFRYGFEVYVFDNSPDYSVEKNFGFDNLRYFTCGKNVGLGRGIATICAQAYYDYNSALVFFDQDTVFNNETLHFIDNFYKENLGMAVSYSAVLFNSKSNLASVNDNKKYLKTVSLAINSGSLFVLKNLKEMNWHNDKYFVDCVDYEFCLNSLIHGFEILEFSATPGFDHTSEQDDSEYAVFGSTYLLRAYPKKRIINTCFASLKLLYRSLSVLEMRFFISIFKFIAIYIATQVFVRTLGFIFRKGDPVESR